jgi:hypothetical protein
MEGCSMPSAVSRPAIIGSKIGGYAASVGAAWTDIDGSDFTVIGPSGTLAATDVAATITIRNTHATQVIYFLPKAGDGEATTLTYRIDAGATMSVDLYGLNVTTMALQGSGAATTANVVAKFV